jgi:tetratricopeptide (TPR) repeat protein
VAKALTRPRGRRSVLERERELKRLCLSVCDDAGFRLYAATYDQPKRRDELIARLSAKARAEKVQVTQLDIAGAVPETSLVGLLRAHLQGEDAPAGWRRAVMMTGIEQRLDYSSGRGGVAFLHQANLLRDALPEAAPVPVVLWLSPLASSAMQNEAPDLWDWRAASFDFTGDQAPRVELLRELTALQPGADLGLSGEQRQVRVQMLEDLLAELERGGPPKNKRQVAERADLLLEHGIDRRRLGLVAEAMPCFERALRLYRGIGDRQGEGAALGNLGLAYAALGEPWRAIEHYEQCLAIAREIGDRRDEGDALGNLGNAYADLGEPRRAIEYHEQALKVSREIGDRQGEGAALGNLGIAYAALGEPRRAIEHYEQCLAIAREIGDRRGEGAALGNLGNAYADLGEPRRAIEHHEQWLAIAREIGDRQGEGKGLFNSALALDQLGERGEAIERVKAALVIFEQIGVEHLAERARAKLAEWQGKGSG